MVVVCVWGGAHGFVGSNAGISRSVSVCVAFLLLSGEESSYERALARVRAVRPGANPNAGFARHLKTLKPGRQYHPSASPLQHPTVDHPL